MLIKNLNAQIVIVMIVKINQTLPLGTPGLMKEYMSVIELPTSISNYMVIYAQFSFKAIELK